MEELSEADAETYAEAFAEGKALGLDNSDARDYASGLMYHTTAFDEHEGTAVAYATAFKQAPDGSVAYALGYAGEAVRKDLNRWPFYISASSNESFSGHYEVGFTQTDDNGVVAHVYAVAYASYRYLGDSEERANELAEATARGYKQSTFMSLLRRIEQATAYREGYLLAEWRAEPEQGFTNERAIPAWATAYGLAFVRGLDRAKNNRWDSPRNAASNYARIYAIAKVELGFGDQSAFLNADSYFRGVNAASERGFTGEDAATYAWHYYIGFFEKGVRAGWSDDRADVYAAAYAEGKREGRTDENASEYASAYEQGYTSSKADGLTEDGARAYAQAFAEGKVGEAPTPTPTS